MGWAVAGKFIQIAASGGDFQAFLFALDDQGAVWQYIDKQQGWIAFPNRIINTLKEETKPEV